jgi:hypothetical protein
MSFITVEVSAAMPETSRQNRSVGANLLHAIHSSEKAARARNSLPDKLTEPAFLTRRRSANQTLILESVKAPPGLVDFVGDEIQPVMESALTESESESILDADTGTDENSKTSVMLRNLPHQLSRDMLWEALHAKGIAKFVDFLYLPFDLKVGAYYGWAYVNFSTAAAAKDCSELLSGSSDWGIPSEQPCEISWCTNHQGLESLTEHYRNSQLMHAKMNDKYKPAVYNNGTRIEFPPPTKKITASRRSVCRQRFFD